MHHSDRGVQYLSIRYTERVSDAGGVTSVCGRGDSYDKALVSHCTSLRWFGPLSVGEAPAQALDEPGIAWRGRFVELHVLVVSSKASSSNVAADPVRRDIGGPSLTELSIRFRQTWCPGADSVLPNPLVLRE